jgi:hypothetical protein
MLSAGWIDTPTIATKRRPRPAPEGGPFVHLPSDAGGRRLSHRGVSAAFAILGDPGDEGGG